MSRRQALIGGVSLLGILAACGSDDDAPSSSTGGGSGPSSVAPDTAATATTVAASVPAGTSEDRAVEDVFGALTIPADPGAVILLGDIVTANALHLGLAFDRIAGVAWNDRNALDQLGHLEAYGDYRSLPDAGPPFDYNLELMAGLHPDLIVSFAFDEDDWKADRDVLAKVGVPVFSVYNGYASLDDTMRYVRDVGTALDLEQAAADAEAAFRAEVEAVRAGLPAKLPTVSTIRPFDDGTFYANSNPLLHALGLPGPHPSIEDATVEYSLENLSMIDADHIFVYTSPSESPDTVRARVEAIELWGNLSAVQNGGVHYVEAVGWLNWDIPAMRLGLADIQRALFS